MAQLVLPFRGSFPVTQTFANQYDKEPSGWRAPDGSINYRAYGKEAHWHNGIDYGLPCGTPLYAACSGVVLEAGMSSSGFGLRVMIADGAGRVVLTGHMSSVSVAAGRTVQQGQPIGASGTTGNSSGCHMHLSVIRSSDGSYIDPAPLLAGPPHMPSSRAGIVYAEFPVQTQRDGHTRVWDGPSEKLRQLDTLPPGTSLDCDAWAYGDAKWDVSANAWDERWYHRKAGGWIASARVNGNAPNSHP